ncbi:ATP-binding protein [Alphaproteobacteria bacterium]|nr:ATP-binding protein [Alphaproteobacteria bacterium]
MDEAATVQALELIASKLASIEARLSGADLREIELDMSAADAFVWQPEHHRLKPVPNVARVPLALLQGIDQVREIIEDNTKRFAAGLPANNALLWGARGMGKSSIVKALHASLVEEGKASGWPPLLLIEIQREDISTLSKLLEKLDKVEARCLLFCDDLSFDHDNEAYKSLKAVLDGGIAGRPENVLFYATSNRRHLMPRDMIDNERATAINPGEAVEEKVSLSDRFGLWLGFHKCNQQDFLIMVRTYADHYGLQIEDDQIRAEALEWATTRGGRSGRVAWQYILDLAGKQGRSLA